MEQHTPPHQPGPVAAEPSAQSDLEAFTDLLKTGAATPAAAFVGISALFALGTQLILGFLAAIASTGSSFIDLSDDSSLFSETFHQAAAFTQASFQSNDFGGFSLSTTPLLFSLIPAGAIWLSFRLFGDRLTGADRKTDAVATVSLCLVFALGMAVVSAIGGDVRNDEVSFGFSEGDVFLLALFWSAVGAALAYMGRFDVPAPPSAVPPQVRGILRLAAIGLRPLLMLLAVCTVIGLAAWEVQVIRDVGGDDPTLSVRGERSLPGAALETVIYAPDIGVHFASLGGMAAFHNRIYPGGLAFPVTKVDELTGTADGDSLDEVESEEAAVSGIFETPGTYRIWDYSEPLPGWAFAVLVLLVPLVLLFWAYAGFITARQGRPDSPLSAAALGALIGPGMGLTMVVLNAFSQNFVYGDGDGGSVFLMFTFASAIVGALGGLLATRVTRRTPAEA
jgi:hypothetical protein